VLFKAIFSEDIFEIEDARAGLAAVLDAQDMTRQAKSAQGAVSGKLNRVYGKELTQPDLPEGCICPWCKKELSKSERNSFSVKIANGCPQLKFTHKCSVDHPQENFRHSVTWENFEKMLKVTTLEEVRKDVTADFDAYTSDLLEDWYVKNPFAQRRKRRERK
jgi:hypothetical protein